MRREVQHTRGMQSGFAHQTPALIEVVIAVQVVIKQGEALDDELTIVGDAGAHIPRVILRKQVVFHVKDHIHWLKDSTLSPILTKRHLRNVTVAKTQLEVPVRIAVARAQHGIELLEFVAFEKAIEIAVFHEQGAFPALHQIDLVSEIQGITIHGACLEAETHPKILGKTEIIGDHIVTDGASRPIVVIFGVGSEHLAGLGTQAHHPRQKQQ